MLDAHSGSGKVGSSCGLWAEVLQVNTPTSSAFLPVLSYCSGGHSSQSLFLVLAFITYKYINELLIFSLKELH